LALVAIALVMTAAACGSSTTDTGSGDGTSTTATPAAGSGGGGGGSGSTIAPGEGSTPETTGSVDLVVVSTPYGDALGTDDGLVVYTWDEEADGTVRCVDAGCLETWPPLLAAEIGQVADLDPSRATLVERPDGGTQVAIDGKPLYHMAADGPGEANCQGASGWWILNPDGTKNTNETARTTTTDLPGY
jgi:predicted lipoprotein with Yx(FWY)xxD motif